MSDQTAFVLIALGIVAGIFLGAVAVMSSEWMKRSIRNEKQRRDCEWMANADKWNRTT